MAHEFDRMSDYIAARARNSDPRGTLVRNCLKEGKIALKKLHACEVEIRTHTVAGAELPSPDATLLRGDPVMLRAYKISGTDTDDMIIAGEMIIRIKPAKLSKLR